MIETNTGKLTVGFREVAVLSGDFESEVTWAKENGFGSLDIIDKPDVKIPAILEKGLRVGSIDLPSREALISPDKSTRTKAIDECRQYMIECVDLLETRSEYPPIFWTMMIPEDPGRSRRENYGYLLESYRELNPVVTDLGARLVVEGWPGPGCVVCTPEGYRSFLRDCQCDSVGVNYDPSHLIRMGIEPLRFLREFASRTFHVHAKDTEILTENLYEFGNELPSIFESPVDYGAHAWRYTIPGHGCMRWKEALRILADCKYRGLVSIELEDANFNLGNGLGEKEGLVHGAAFLAGC